MSTKYMVDVSQFGTSLFQANLMGNPFVGYKARALLELQERFPEKDGFKLILVEISGEETRKEIPNSAEVMAELAPRRADGTYQARPGSSVSDFASHLLWLARRTNEPVTGTFNDVKMLAHPKDDVSDVADRYWTNRK